MVNGLAREPFCPVKSVHFSLHNKDYQFQQSILYMDPTYVKLAGRLGIMRGQQQHYAE
jgi:hypothetical protein